LKRFIANNATIRKFIDKNPHMSDIKIREEKMKAKRMQTPFRDFVKEICSRYGLLFNKERGQFTNHAPVPRMKLVDIKTYEEIRN